MNAPKGPADMSRTLPERTRPCHATSPCLANTKRVLRFISHPAGTQIPAGSCILTEDFGTLQARFRFQLVIPAFLALARSYRGDDIRVSHAPKRAGPCIT